jgi:predicted ATPase
MAVIAIAGLPGSGKSVLVNEYAAAGFLRFDDVYAGDGAQVTAARQAIAEGRDVVVSDIQFCDPGVRADAERQFGPGVEWVYFANDPYQCARNVLYRAFVGNEPRDWVDEMGWIDELTRVYRPPATARPVPVTP